MPRLLLFALAFLGFPADAVCAEPATSSAVPVKVMTKVLISSSPAEIEKAVLSAEEFEAQLGREAARANVTLCSLPSVVMKQEEPATIQVVRSKNPGEVWDGGKPVQPFAGWILHLAPTPAGRQLKLDAQAAYGFVPGSHPVPNQRLSQDPDWAKVVTKTNRGGATLSTGAALVIPLGEVEPGVHVTCFAQVQPIDPSGPPNPDFSRRIPVPVPDSVPGTLRAHATLIGQTRDAKALSLFQFEGPSLSLVAILSPDHLTVLEEEKTIEIQKLDPVEFPTGKPLHPWKELKSLKLSGSLPKSRAMIDLTCSLESDAGATKTDITIYPGSAVVYSLPSDKPDVGRFVAVVLEIVE